MFPQQSNSCPTPQILNQNSNMSNQDHNQVSQKSLQIKMSHSRDSRQGKLSRMRQINSVEFLKYEDVNFYKFVPLVQKQTNPFTILLTIFAIADNYSWRQYLSHMEILIKKFTNFVQFSKGKVLEQISNRAQWKTKLAGYNFQERFQTMLHLSNKEFQQHLLILIHALVAYNKRYCLLDQASLSDHLTFRHSYEKSIRPQVQWLLTRMSISVESMNKILKNLTLNPQNSSFMLPTLTMLANFIYQQPEHIIQQLIASNDFQNIVGRGLTSSLMQSQRQSVLICNNIIMKNQRCCNFILNQHNLINQIQKLDNQQVYVFNTIFQSLRDKVVHVMDEENTS